MSRYVSEIFNEHPKQWGLRGDPFLWKDLIDYYSLVQLPYPVEDLHQDIYMLFKQVTGVFPVGGKDFFAKKYAGKHVGMSTGLLSSDFWLDTALPLLSERLEKANQVYCD